jgi:hypothetical protein
MQPHLDPRRDAEVAASPAQTPEQLGILVLVRADDLAGGSDDLCADHVVAGEAVLGGQVSDPPAEGEAGDPGRADHAAGRDQAVGLGRRVEVEPGGAALGDSEAGVGIDLHVPHPREVDHQAVVDRAVSGRVVTPAADSDLKGVRLRELEGAGDIRRIDAPSDRRRPPVDQQVEAEPRPLVLAISRREDVA